MRLVIIKELDIFTFRASVSDDFGLTIHSNDYSMRKGKFDRSGGELKEYLNTLGL